MRGSKTSGGQAMKCVVCGAELYKKGKLADGRVYYNCMFCGLEEAER